METDVAINGGNGFTLVCNKTFEKIIAAPNSIANSNQVNFGTIERPTDSNMKSSSPPPISESGLLGRIRRGGLRRESSIEVFSDGENEEKKKEEKEE